MIQQAGRMFRETMREWPRAGGALRRMGGARAAFGRLPRLRERPSGAWSSRFVGGIGGARLRTGLAALAAGLALAGILLYLRKRRQVAAHYTMGDGEAAWQGGTADAFRDAETARR